VYIEKPMQPAYDLDAMTLRVCSGGVSKLHGHRYFLTGLFFDQDVGRKETADRLLSVSYNFQQIGNY
jgi:hypothetical protein